MSNASFSEGGHARDAVHHRRRFNWYKSRPSLVFSRNVITLLIFMYAGCCYSADEQQPPRSITSLHMAGIYEEAARTLALEFESQTGIHVTISGAMLSNLREKELTDVMTAGGNFDVMQVPHQWEGEMLPRLQPLDDVMDKIVPDLDDIIPNVRTNCGLWAGHTYGFPMACDVITILYRRDLFEARADDFKKLTGKRLGPPQTWDDYVATAKFLSSESTYGNILMGGDQLYTVWSGILYGMGGRPVDESWNPQLDSAEAVRSLTLFCDMFRYAPSHSESRGIHEANVLFLQGHGAMYICWPSLIWSQMKDTNVSKVGGKLGAAVVPGRKPQLSSWCLGVNPACKDKDAAYRWISFFVNRSNSKKLLLENGIGSPRLSTYSDPVCREKIFYLREMFEGLKGAEPRFRIAPSQEMTEYLDNELLKTIQGGSTPQNALNRTAARWKKIFSESGVTKN